MATHILMGLSPKRSRYIPVTDEILAGSSPVRPAIFIKSTIFIIMIKLTDIINEIELDKVKFVSPNEAGFDYSKSLDKLIIDSGLYIKLYKELLVLAIIDQRVVGALFGGLRGKTFEFDIMVDKSIKSVGLQKDTIASRLINMGIQEFKSIRDMVDNPDEYKLELDVINPNLIPYLERLGFHKKIQYPNHVIMTL